MKNFVPNKTIGWIIFFLIIGFLIIGFLIIGDYQKLPAQFLATM